MEPNAKELRDIDKFIEAAGNGEKKEVAWRILHGQAINARHDYLQLTALMAAARSGHDEVVMLLLEEGARVDLAHRITGYTALHYASATGRSSVVQNLLSLGANKSLRTKVTEGGDRMTPLQLAEAYHKEDVRALLRDPPCLMDDPLLTHFNKESFSIMWAAPISKGSFVVFLCCLSTGYHFKYL